MKPALFLDRDGVLNADSPLYIKSADEWQPLPLVAEALSRLAKKYTLFVVSNQAGLAKTIFKAQDLAEIHRKMHSYFARYSVYFEAVFFCPHRDEDACLCRKPLAGMLTDIMLRYGFKAKDCVMVGDSLRDIEAAEAAGVAKYLVLTGNGASVAQRDLPHNTQTIANLKELERYIG